MSKVFYFNIKVLRCFNIKRNEIFLTVALRNDSNDKRARMRVSKREKNKCLLVTFQEHFEYNIRRRIHSDFYLSEKIGTTLYRDTEPMRWNSSSFRQHNAKEQQTTLDEIMEFSASNENKFSGSKESEIRFYAYKMF